MRWILSMVLLLSVIAPAASINSEKVWDNIPRTADIGSTYFTEKLKQLVSEKKASSFVLGKTKQGRNLEAYYFPGRSNYNALVVGGVHGSELSSIEVSSELIRQLQAGRTVFYNVIIIPCLFPDNAAKATSIASEIGSEKNIGRYSFSYAADPNRQMPTPGQCLDQWEQKDHAGRAIENENRYFLQLVQAFKPRRIASLHAIRNKEYSGFFADPRTDEESIALGFETDSSLAVTMARIAEEQGGRAPGNRLNEIPNALYHKDPAPVARGLFQKRNYQGSSLAGSRGKGISLGSWATTAVKDQRNPGQDRPAIRLITIEFPGSKRPGDYHDQFQQHYCARMVKAYATAIGQVFLGDYFIED